MFQQRVQNATRSLASAIAVLRRRASSRDSFSRWKAMRWADFGPMPGSRPSSSMRSWTGPAYTAVRSTAQQPAQGAHRFLLGRGDGRGEVVEGGVHEVGDLVGLGP